jgi:hypothetical protein
MFRQADKQTAAAAWQLHTFSSWPLRHTTGSLSMLRQAMPQKWLQQLHQHTCWNAQQSFSCQHCHSVASSAQPTADGPTHAVGVDFALYTPTDATCV